LLKRDFSEQLKANLTDAAETYISGLCKTSGKANPNSALRFPLQLALLISPLCLLLPQSLEKKSFNRSSLMQWSIHLGADKPEVLQQTEKRIWKAILEIVNRPGDYLAILKDLASAFSLTYTQELQKQAETMTGWFNIDLRQSEVPASARSNTVRNSLEGNTEGQASSSGQSESSRSPISPSPRLLEDPNIYVTQPETSAFSPPSLASQSNEASVRNEADSNEEANRDEHGNTDTQPETSALLPPSVASQSNEASVRNEADSNEEANRDENANTDAQPETSALSPPSLASQSNEAAARNEEAARNEVAARNKADSNEEMSRDEHANTDAGMQDQHMGEVESVGEDRVVGDGVANGNEHTNTDAGVQDQHMGEVEEMGEDQVVGDGEANKDDHANTDAVMQDQHMGEVEAMGEHQDDLDGAENEADTVQEMGDDSDRDAEMIVDEDSQENDDEDRDGHRRSNRQRNSQVIERYEGNTGPVKKRRNKNPSSADKATSSQNARKVPPTLLDSQTGKRVSALGESLKILHVCNIPCILYLFIFFCMTSRRSQKQPHSRTATQKRFIWVNQ
jgi:hypothetical protein